MAAKSMYLLILGLCVGCSSEDLKRVAPPGFIRYEDLAKGEPISPALKSKMEEVAADKNVDYPVLHEQPDARPRVHDDATVKVIEDALLARREALQAQIDKARRNADAERAEDLEAMKAALQIEVEADKSAAAGESRLPIPPSE